MDEIIYQYLPLNTFHTSITNKTIRLCDITKSNDYLEKKIYRDKLKPAIDQAFEMFELPISADSKTATGDTFFECMEKELDDYLEHVTFVSCFSRKGDMLSQWRGYANDAEGMAIGYDRTILERCFRDDPRFRVVDIAYEGSKQIDLLTDVIVTKIFTIKNDYEIRTKGNLIRYLVNEFEEVLFEITEDIVPVVCSLKNPAFYEEQEVRIVFDPGWYDLFEDEAEPDYTKINRCARLQMRPINYFTRNGSLIPFVDLNYEKAINAGIIKKIVIGPKANVTPTELEHYLYFNGFCIDAIEKIDIVKSNLSYR